MKKGKISLHNLQVKSFITDKANKVKGGLSEEPPIRPSHTYCGEGCWGNNVN